MNPKYDMGKLLSPGFSKNLEENTELPPPPSLPVNIFEIKVDDYLKNNVIEISVPIKQIDENTLNSRYTRQALGMKSSNGNFDYPKSSMNRFQNQNISTNPFLKSNFIKSAYE